MNLPLPGRCACGVAFELIHREDADLHLACRGERRCVQCFEVKPLIAGFAKAGHGRRTSCRVCCRPYQAQWGRKKRRRSFAWRQNEAQRVKLYRVLGPKTGSRKGSQPRTHPAEKPCKMCKIVYPDIQFIIGPGRRGSKCKDCYRAHRSQLARGRKRSQRKEEAA